MRQAGTALARNGKNAYDSAETEKIERAANFQGRKDLLVPYTVSQLAELVQGRVVGDGAVIVQAAHTLHEAKAGDITFVENPSYLPQLEQSPASFAVVPIGTNIAGKTTIECADPLMAFAAILQAVRGITAAVSSGIHAKAVLAAGVRVGADPSIQAFAVVNENTKIGDRCQVHSGVVIGKNCQVGSDVILYPNVVLYDNVVIGDRSIIHANAVIGADGFGYRFHQGKHVKVPQVGGVRIGNDVEIGACATIDGGAFEPTIIEDGTKIDNHVQVAHNCKIGKHNLLAAQTGLGGSCTTGNYVVMAGQVGVKDHTLIGDGTVIGAKSGVMHDFPAGSRIYGAPAQNERAMSRIFNLMNKLPDMRKDLLRVMKHLGLNENHTIEKAA